VAEVKQEELKIKNLYGVGEVLFLPSTLQYSSLLIYDVYGREVYKNTSNKNAFLFTHGGIYFYQLQTNNTWHNGKIVVQ
jgi:hypothetical protein